MRIGHGSMLAQELRVLARPRARLLAAGVSSFVSSAVSPSCS